MAVEREAAVRLDLQETGEKDVFKQAVEGVKTLQTGASEATADLEKLAQSLEGVDLSALGASAEEVAELREEWARLEQLVASGRTEEAAEQLQRALAKLGPVLERAGDQGAAALEHLQTSLRSLERAGGNALDPLEGSLASARRAAAAFGEAVAKGGDDAVRAGGRATHEINRLEQAIHEAAAAGREIKGVSAEFDALADSVSSNTQQLASGRNAQREFEGDLRRAEDAAGGVNRNISSMDDLIQEVAKSLGPGAARWAAWGAAAVAAFTVGYQSGLKFRELIDELGQDILGIEDLDGKAVDAYFQLWGINIDAIGEKFDSWTHKIAGTEGALVDVNQQLENQRRIFEELGIPAEKFSASLDRNNALIEEGARSRQQLAATGEKIAASYGLSRREVDAEAASLVKNVETLKKTQKGLEDSQLAAAISGDVQKILAAYKRLGVEPPKDLQALITALDVLPKGMARAADGTIVEAKKLKEGVKAEVEDMAEVMKERAEGLVAAFRAARNAGGEQLRGLAPDFKVVAAELQASGQLVSREFAEMARALGIYIDTAKIAPDVTREMAAANRDAAQSAQGLTAAEFDLQKALDSLNLQRAYDGVETLGDAAAATSEYLATMSEKTRESEDRAGRFGERVEKAAEAAGKIGDRKIAEGVSDLGDAFSDAGDSLVETTTDWEGTAETIQRTGDSARESAEGAAQLATDLDAVADRAAELKEAAQGLPEILQGLAKVDFGPSLAGLEKIVALAAQVQAGLAAARAEAVGLAAAVAAVGADGAAGAGPADEVVDVSGYGGGR